MDVITTLRERKFIRSTAHKSNSLYTSCQMANGLVGFPSQPIKRSFLVPKVPLPRMRALGCSSEMSFPRKEEAAEGQFVKVA